MLHHYTHQLKSAHTKNSPIICTKKLPKYHCTKCFQKICTSTGLKYYVDENSRDINNRLKKPIPFPIMDGARTERATLYIFEQHDKFSHQPILHKLHEKIDFDFISVVLKLESFRYHHSEDYLRAQLMRSTSDEAVHSKSEDLVRKPSASSISSIVKNKF